MSTAFDDKYRPHTLDKIIGHEKAVTRLQGIISSKKIPNSMLFVGPSSAGKTTLARAFVASLFGVDNVESGNIHDFHELNGADTRGVDDIRDLLKISNLKPRLAPKRVILIDEAHQLTSTSANLLLKPMENPPPHTLWIIGSMEPEKLLQAMKNRCSQFVLESHPKVNLAKFAKRIAKGEGMDYMSKELLFKVAEASNGEMRSCAKLMEAVDQYVQGSGSKKINESDIDEALSTFEGVDDQLAVKVIVAIYAGKFKAVQKALLDVQDPFKLIGKLLQLNTFLLNQEVLGGVQHKAVWWSPINKDTLAGVKEYGTIPEKKLLDAYATVQDFIVELRGASGAFMVAETALISTYAFRAIQRLKIFKAKA